jgi:hypothetical protein
MKVASRFIASISLCFVASLAHADGEPTPRDQAKSFAPEVALLFTNAACGKLVGPNAPAPAANEQDAKVVAGHCKDLEPLITGYSDFWKSTIEPVIAQIVPREKGTTIVYPFGGGDLVTALGTYTEAKEITTLSLELTGDARGFASLAPDRLKSELQRARSNLEKLYRVKHSRTENLGFMTHGGVSGEIVFALTALRIRGAEPINLRYFDITPEGTLDYLSEADVQRVDDDLKAKKIDARAAAWAFSNVEIEFRKVGESTTRIFRHIAANLDDEHVAKSPGVMKHLEKKGRVLAMTKAASYLLWWAQFSAVREYLAKNVDFMISDSTGLPPDTASKNGFKQYTFGRFGGPYLGDPNSNTSQAFKTLWKTQPQRTLNFRYGYPDINKESHMLVTTKLDWTEPKL